MSHIKTWKERKGLLNTEPFRAFIGVEWEMQAEIDELRAALAQPEPVEITDERIRQIAESVADDMWPEVGYVGWTDEDKEFYGRFAKSVLAAVSPDVVLGLLDRVDQAAQPDCRSCDSLRISYADLHKYCLKPNCTNGDQYQPAPKVVLWRTKQ